MSIKYKTALRFVDECNERAKNAVHIIEIVLRSRNKNKYNSPFVLSLSIKFQVLFGGWKNLR